jgi:hypothetical protein
MTQYYYVFTRSGSTWTQQQKLVATDPASGGFGSALALSGDRALISDGSRTAYLFRRSGAVWSQGPTLQADAERRNSASFAASVALSGSTALAGTPLHDLADRQRVGVAYLFDL